MYEVRDGVLLDCALPADIESAVQEMGLECAAGETDREVVWFVRFPTILVTPSGNKPLDENLVIRLPLRTWRAMSSKERHIFNRSSMTTLLSRAAVKAGYTR